MQDLLAAIVDLVVVVAVLVAIPLSFVRGRKALGWLLVGFVTVGATVSFPLFRMLRERGWSEWFWAWRALGLLAAIAALVLAARPARTAKVRSGEESRRPARR